MLSEDGTLAWSSDDLVLSDEELRPVDIEDITAAMSSADFGGISPDEYERALADLGRDAAVRNETNHEDDYPFGKDTDVLDKARAEYDEELSPGWLLEEE